VKSDTERLPVIFATIVLAEIAAIVGLFWLGAQFS